MFSRFSNSWKLGKASWDVMASNKSLALFPVISSVVTGFVILVMAGGALAIFSDITSNVPTDTSDLSISQIIYLFISYAIAYTVIIYFNSALIGAALQHLHGEKPSLGSGLRLANSRITAIIGYALISATIGVVLTLLRDRGGLVGAVASIIGNIAWNLATFLVVPVLVSRDVGPIGAIKESASLLRKTWGEQVVGSFGIGVFTLVLLLPVGLVGGLLVAGASALSNTVFMVGAIVVLVIGVAVVLIISSTLTSIYRAAVYQYAAEGVVSNDFDQNMIEAAFKPKSEVRI